MSAAEAGGGPTASGARASSRGKSGVAWVVVLVLVLGGVATALAMMDREAARPFILGMLALLAVVGVFTLFALAIGLIRFGATARPVGFDVGLAEHLPEGILVTDNSGQILFANAAYRGMTGARSQDEALTIERLFALEHAASEQIYRLSQASAEGRPHQEDIRLARTPLDVVSEDRDTSDDPKSEGAGDTNIGPPSPMVPGTPSAVAGRCG